MDADTGSEIPGTTLFDGAQARKGYALNKMCCSFNDAANRESFRRDEDAYCAGFVEFTRTLDDRLRARTAAENYARNAERGSRLGELVAQRTASG